MLSQNITSYIIHMDCQKSFANKYTFTRKENPWKDVDSFLSQEHLVGIFPIHNIPSIPHKKQLDNYGIPAGMVHFAANPLRVGGGREYHQKPTQLIDEADFENLLQLVSQNRSPPKNKTKKIRIKKNIA